MANLQLSIIIPTYNRPQLLPRAVESALAQTVEDLEVIVVDDASKEPVHLPEHPQLKIIHLPENKGGAAARNLGTKAARGRWITFLDDDDRLLPHMAEISLAAVQTSTLPPPVGVLSGLEVLDREGKVIQKRLPPTLPRGSHFSLETIAPDRSFLSKQTLVVERDVLLEIGGFDESFTSRIHTELFLRLNPVCSLLGLPEITYQLSAHDGPRVSRDPALRQANFYRLIRKHQAIFQSHPKAFADFLYAHAQRSLEGGQMQAAAYSLLWAIRVQPRHILGKMSWPYRQKLQNSLQFGR